MNKSKALLQERLDTVHKAIGFEKTDRIPTHSVYFSWMILDAGLKMSDAIYHYDILEDVISQFHERYQFDFYNYIGHRNPFRVFDAVDGNAYVVDDEKEMISITEDHNFMESPDEEYKLLIDNPIKYLWELVIPRKCKTFNTDKAVDSFVDSVKELNTFDAFMARMTDKFVHQYGVPNKSILTENVPFEFLFNYLRGIKGVSIDLRRRPKLLFEACKAIEGLTGSSKRHELIHTLKPADDTIFSTYICLLGHSILTVKQFEELYWPYIKNIIDGSIKNNQKVMIFSEAFIGRFYEFFQDVPKGVIMLQLEQDNVFDIRKKLPNVAISGGMTTDLLGRKSKEECLEYAKVLVDELGKDGGFIMGQNKMVSYRNDAKRENVLAVQEFCRNYKG